MLSVATLTVPRMPWVLPLHVDGVGVWPRFADQASEPSAGRVARRTPSHAPKYTSPLDVTGWPEITAPPVFAVHLDARLPALLGVIAVSPGLKPVRDPPKRYAGQSSAAAASVLG